MKVPVLGQQSRVAIQGWLTRLGEHVTATQIQKLNACLNYLEVGRWLKANGFRSAARHGNRDELYRALASRIAQQKVLYLEFGVWQGTSLRRWCKLLQNPDSSLHGFDSFEGLPEDWDARRPQGTFDVRGALPKFDDPRVVLHKGWFNETLPAFALPEHDRLVINVDADLYSSTIYVLDQLRDAMRPGTVIIFDEFCDRLHELRAFGEFLEKTGMRFDFVGGTGNLEQAAFERRA
jgi:hypothetical protein